MKQYIRKADIILFIVLVLAGLAASAVIAVSGGGSGNKVIIESGGKLYATYDLFEDRTVIVPAPKAGKVDRPAANPDDPASVQYDYYNIVEISGGKVKVTEASCKNQVCVNHAEISGPGESIICLPNRLVVRIEGSGSEEGGGYDSVTS